MDYSKFATDAPRYMELGAQRGLVYNTLMQPGDTITPGSSPPAPSPHEEPPTDTTPKAPASQPPATDQAAPSPPPNEQHQWQFKPEDTAPHDSGQPSQAVNVEAVSWTASEYIAHQKGAVWYGILAAGTLVGTVLVYLVTRDKISAGTIAVVAIILGVFAARKPRTLQYQVDSIGVHIATKTYPYELFKSFAVMDEGGVSSIALMPLKRLMPTITMYYEPADEDKIVNALGAFLPYEERKHDAVDQLMRKLRF
jgi:hypothetical protein